MNAGEGEEETAPLIVLFISGLSMSGRPKSSVLPQSSGCNRFSGNWEIASASCGRRRDGHRKSLQASADCIAPTSGPSSAEKKTSPSPRFIHSPRLWTRPSRGSFRGSPRTLSKTGFIFKPKRGPQRTSARGGKFRLDGGQRIRAMKQRNYDEKFMRASEKTRRKPCSPCGVVSNEPVNRAEPPLVLGVRSAFSLQSSATERTPTVQGNECCRDVTTASGKVGAWADKHASKQGNHRAQALACTLAGKGFAPVIGLIMGVSFEWVAGHRFSEDGITGE